MDAYFYEAVVKGLVGEGVVIIFGVSGVYCEGEGVPEVTAAFDVFRGDGGLDGRGFFFYVRLKAVGEAELSEDGVHFSLVVPGLAKHVHNVPARGRGLAVPAVHRGGHLHSALGARGLDFFRVKQDVVRHCAGLHQHPGHWPCNVQDAHKRNLGMLHYLHYLSFTAVPFSSFLGDNHFNYVSVKGVPGLGGFHKNVLILAVYDNENESVPRHLYFSSQYTD